MPAESPEKTKVPLGAERPFPWRCRHCFADRVVNKRTSYDAHVRHDGRVHEFRIEAIDIPTCEACGQRVFTEIVDADVRRALVAHLRMLTPTQIRDAIARIGMTQKQVADHLGITEETLDFWINEVQIQSRSMDNLMRAFFAFPEVRIALCGEAQNPLLGTSDVTGAT